MKQFINYCEYKLIVTHTKPCKTCEVPIYWAKSIDDKWNPFTDLVLDSSRQVFCVEPHETYKGIPHLKCISKSGPKYKYEDFVLFSYSKEAADIPFEIIGVDKRNGDYWLQSKTLTSKASISWVDKKARILDEAGKLLYI